MVWRFLLKLGIKPLSQHDPAIPLLGIYPEETKIERDTCIPLFIAALFTIARTWKQPRCPSIDEWIKMWYCPNMTNWKPEILKVHILSFSLEDIFITLKQKTQRIQSIQICTLPSYFHHSFRPGHLLSQDVCPILVSQGRREDVEPKYS